MIPLRGFTPIVALLAACGGGEEEAPVTRLPAVEVVYTEQVVSRKAGDCALPESPCATFFAEYPAFQRTGGERVRRALEEAVDGMLLRPLFEGPRPESVEAVAEQFLEAWQEARQEHPDAASTARWSMERRVWVRHVGERVLTLELAERQYTGGAHPDSRTAYAVFDLGTGERLELRDLLLPGSMEELERLAEARFREVRRIPEGASLAEAGFDFPEDEFALSGNFAVTGSGLIFHYDPYEVAPYAVGPTEVLLTRKELVGLVPENGPLAPQTPPATAD